MMATAKAFLLRPLDCRALPALSVGQASEAATLVVHRARGLFLLAIATAVGTRDAHAIRTLIAHCTVITVAAIVGVGGEDTALVGKTDIVGALVVVIANHGRIHAGTRIAGIGRTGVLVVAIGPVPLAGE